MNLPPYPHFPVIVGTEVTLRQIRPSDVPHVIDISYYNGIRATTLHEATATHARTEKDYVEGKLIHWGIADNRTDGLVGNCGYYRGFANGAGQLGCVLLPQHRGKGLMTEALTLAIHFGQHTMGLGRIWAATDLHNTKARQLLQRLGFAPLRQVGDNGIEYDLFLSGSKPQ